MAKVRFGVGGPDLEVPLGTPLSDVMQAYRPYFSMPCGCRGVCGKCKVGIRGDAGQITQAEATCLSESDLASGLRLACQAVVNGDILVEIVRAEACACITRTNLNLSRGAAGVETRHARVDMQSSNPGTCFDIVLEALGSPSVWSHRRLGLTQVAALISDGVTELDAVLVEGKMVDAGPSSGRHAYGIALDIGTTTLVAHLVDPATSRIIASSAGMNPQASFGADIISRISRASTLEGLKSLQSTVICAVNALIERVVGQAGISADDIYSIIAVGNTCMHHLFLGISPKPLATLPYRPAARDVGPLDPVPLGIRMNPWGIFRFLPCIAGFVGSDAIATALACGLDKAESPTLAVDIGTNGEIVLSAQGRMAACSTAAGPAFEGVNISCGMIASEGAVERAWVVEIDDGLDIEIAVIGGGAPSGICGSGLISLVAALSRAGVVDETGRFMPSTSLGPRIGSRLTDKGFLVSALGPVLITQRDIREFQLAKGALRAGIEVLMDYMGLKPEDIAQVHLAGAFGTYVDTEAALFTGMLPIGFQGKISSAGNAAGYGAALCLHNLDMLHRALALGEEIEHVELAHHTRFQQVFADSMLLGPY